MKTLIFHYWGGQGRNHGCQSDFLVLNILKEADINFVFKVLDKFGDNKHNEDIKINVEKKCVFFHRRGVGGGQIWMENSITFNVFFIETFPNSIKISIRLRNYKPNLTLSLKISTLYFR